MVFDQFLSGLESVPGYKTVYIRDRNPVAGRVKTRKLLAPDHNMMILHRRFLGYLRNPQKCPRLSQIRTFAWGTGSRGRGSLKEMVLSHRHRNFFVLLDIKNAFGSVDVKRLVMVLCREYPELSGQEDSVLAFLINYCVDPKKQVGLPLGLPASNDLFDLFMGVLVDEPLALLVKQYDLHYSRWTDDLTFSAREPIGYRKRLAIRSIIAQSGLTISNRKCHTHNLQKHGPVEICGVGLRLNGRVFVSKRYRTHLFGLLYLALQGLLPITKEIKIPGQMGPFLSLIPKNCGVRDILNLNRSELKLYRLYQEWHKARIDIIRPYFR